jgi:hypothetical protein
MTTKETVEDRIFRGLGLFYAENRVLDKLPPRPTTPRFSSIDYDGFSCGPGGRATPVWLLYTPIQIVEHFLPMNC